MKMLTRLFQGRLVELAWLRDDGFTDASSV
jgi:hypothetical protein